MSGLVIVGIRFCSLLCTLTEFEVIIRRLEFFYMISKRISAMAFLFRPFVNR